MCISVFLSCPINWNLTGCRSQNLPPGGRGTAKRWMRNGDTFPFVMQSIQTVQPFPMYLFNEMHTDSEHIAVPHPPQCAHWGTFPPGEGIAFRHPYKHQFIGQLSKVNKHKFLYGKFLRRGVSSWVGPTIKASWGKAVKGEKEACGKPPFISVVFPGSRGSGR